MLYMYMLGPVCTVICRIWPCVQTIERYDHEIKLVGPRLGSLALFLLSSYQCINIRFLYAHF